MIQRYLRWLHTSWPAGVVEKLPEVREDGSTNVAGFFVAGDLTGVPLLKFAADGGARLVRRIAEDSEFQAGRGKAGEGVHDLVIVGAGVSGVAAALEARALDLDCVLVEAREPFATIVDFPKAKPIFTYPTEMTPAGSLQPTAKVKEALLDELRAQSIELGLESVRARAEQVERRGPLLEVVLAGEENLLARRVIVAIGRSGNYRKLGVPGEERDKVYNRLHDPKDFAGRRALVVGGGDSALETAIALGEAGAAVTLSYRKPEFARPKPDNIERLEALTDRIELCMASQLRGIEESEVVLGLADGSEARFENDVVFAMIGREPPLDFFRRSGVRLRGESSRLQWVAVVAFFLLIFLVYDWKGEGWFVKQVPSLSSPTAFPQVMPSFVAGWGDWWAAQVADRSTIVGTLAVSLKSRSFYYTLLYTTAIGVFGWRRVRRRRTPYVKLQTLTLFLIQLFPLFLLPELLLPWLGYNGWFDAGLGRTIADQLFDLYIPADQYIAQAWPEWGHPRAYWRAYGFVLAWPLSVYNVFTNAPLAGWLIISFLQTFVLIPLLVWRWGKGAYCGWICSCGGLAETAGDTLRHKMPHGPRWNRLNFIGQFILAGAFVLLLIRILGWIYPESFLASGFSILLEGKNAAGEFVSPISWKWGVDVLLGGVIGVGSYMKFSGRVWCRFACPLAALMHVYARFSQFRILAEKKKCISCNVCTSVCHQGIDIMGFANKGRPMEDPECVRCSACVQSCPTGVLSFGRVDRKSGEILGRDSLRASLLD